MEETIFDKIVRGEIDSYKVWSDHTVYNDEYLGYITTAEGPKMDDNELKATQVKIISAQKG